MRWIKRGFWLTLALLIAMVLHYNLPQTDIVRIVGASTKRVDFAENSFFWSGPEAGAATDGVTRDVFFIESIRPNGKPMVYRNEDTAWGWPPYFKFNSYNVQATASSLISGAENTKWVAIKHYGWRNEFLNAFPNAISLREVAGPDVRIIPWAAIIIMTGLVLFIILIWRMLAQFRERMIEPMVDRAGDRADEARDRARGFWRRVSDWFSGLFGSGRR